MPWASSWRRSKLCGLVDYSPNHKPLLTSFTSHSRKMSGWRTLKTTGTNDTPLGSRRRFGAAPVEDQAPPQLAAPSPNDFPRARPQEPERNERKREYEQSSSTPGTSVAHFLPFALILV
jgi:hypothetical protein